MFLKTAEPVGRCGIDNLRYLLFHTQWTQGAPSVHAEGVWEALGVNIQLNVILASRFMFLKYRVKEKKAIS